MSASTLLPVVYEAVRRGLLPPAACGLCASESALWYGEARTTGEETERRKEGMVGRVPVGGGRARQVRVTSRALRDGAERKRRREEGERIGLRQVARVTYKNGVVRM